MLRAPVLALLWLCVFCRTLLLFSLDFYLGEKTWFKSGDLYLGEKTWFKSGDPYLGEETWFKFGDSYGTEGLISFGAE